MADPIRFPFTRPRLDAEPAPVAGRKTVWDEGVHGLCCRITPDGNRSLWFCKWVKGAQRWIRIGDHPGGGVKDARDRVLTILAAITKGERPWETAKALRNEATLADLWAHFESHHAQVHKRASSLASDRSIWMAVLDPWGGKKQLSGITRAEVQRLLNAKGKTAPIRANRTAALLSTMFNRAIADGLWTGANPAEGVQRFKEKSRDRYLRPDELKALFLSLAHEDEAWALYFRASVLCGARRGNMLAMRWAELDLDRGLWRVPGEQSKNGEPLHIVLVPDLVMGLREWRARCPSPIWVFPSSESASGHKMEPHPAWHRVLVRAECFRLVAILARAHAWTPEESEREYEAVLVEVGRLRLLALGRKMRSSGDPLGQVLEALRQRTTEAGQDPLGGGMLDVRLHDLRRTLGSWAAMTGASTSVIGKALGHRSPQATAIYARLSMDPVRAAVQTAADAMMAAAGDQS